MLSAGKMKTIFQWLKKNPYWSALILLGACVVVGVYIPGLLRWSFDNGTLGDAFGYWNSIFSGVALIGIVVSIVLQSKELKLQRDELAKTSDALSGQLDQQRKDNFEATFFRTLAIFQNVADNARLPESICARVGNTHRGFESFQITFDVLGELRYLPEAAHAQVRAAQDHPFRNFANDVRIEDFVGGLYRELSDEFGQYYRLLFNLLEMIDEADFLPHRRRYANLVRASLTKPQVVLLALNCAADEAREKFQPLVVRWRMLKYLPSEYVQTFCLNRFYPDGLCHEIPDETAKVPAKNP